MKSNVNILQQGRKYSAPAMTQMELLSEGILCGSTEMGLTVDDWVRENGLLEF